MSDILATITKWIKTESEQQGLTLDVQPETLILETQILSSIKLLDLILFIEEKFGIKLPTEKLVPENFETPAAVVKMIETEIES